MPLWSITEPLWADFDVDISVSQAPRRFGDKSRENKDKFGMDRVAAKAELERLLSGEKLTFEAAAVRLKMSATTVRRWCRTLGIGRYARDELKSGRQSTSSQIPFGWSAEHGLLKEKPEEAKWVLSAQKMRAAGESFGSIAKHFQTMGVATKNGGRWHAKTIWQILEFNLPLLNALTKKKK